MPKIAADRLEEIGRALFVAAGAPNDEATLVMRHIVGANLVGHDSHGVIQIPTYIDRIKAGHIVPGAPWVIVKELPTTTVVDGNWGFGYVANERAMRLTIEKAEKSEGLLGTLAYDKEVGTDTRTFIRNLRERGILRYRDEVLKQEEDPRNRYRGQRR